MSFVPFWLTDRVLTYQFRKVIPARLGESVSHTCDLSSETPYWYDVNGQRISKSQLRYQVSISAFQAQLILLNLTLDNAGVYFCKGTTQYGSLIIYVRGNVCNFLNTKKYSGMQHKHTFEEGEQNFKAKIHV